MYLWLNENLEIMNEKQITYHFVYYENETDTFSKGINIQGNDFVDCAIRFELQVGKTVEVAYRVRTKQKF